MRRFVLLFTLFIFYTTFSVAQGFSFSCTKDTLLQCGPACITLKAIIPDIHGIGNGYDINPVTDNGGCRIPVPPDAPGPSAGFSADDRYSDSIPIGFPFPFYGSVYNKLLLSTNGYISFDISKADLFSHYAMPTTWPSTAHDRAIIMGVYHDLDPSATSYLLTNYQTKYETLGTAPARRFVYTIYGIPLFSSPEATCGIYNNSSQQIILYESTGVIEIVINSKEICTAWQSGKAMVGIQNYNRNFGVTVPGRFATDPPWGSIGMNEVWRFVPTSGPSLFKRVELYDLGGTLLSTGTAVGIGGGSMEASFPNTCPGNGTTTYVVKSVYEKFDDPATEIFGFDTVNVVRINNLPATYTTTPASCGITNGSITVTPTSGTSPFTFSLNGGPVQNNGLFNNLAAGTYSVFISDAAGCNNTITNIIVGSVNNLSATALATPTSCPTVNNGIIDVRQPTGGTAPHSYSLNGGPFQPGSVFTNLAPGTYTIDFIDVNGCTGTTTATVIQGSSLSSTIAVVNPPCAGINNGSITVTPVTGTGPFSFSLNGGLVQASGVFTNLAVGPYNIVFTDAIGCQGSVNTSLVGNTPLNATASFTNALCFGTATGTITISPAGGTAPYTYSVNGGAFSSGNFIPNLAAGNYNITARDDLGCTQNLPVTITEPVLLTAANNVIASTCNGNDGSITISQNGGTAPYQYSVDNGLTYQSSNTFILGPGNYPNIRVKDANDCIASTSGIITLLDTMRLSAGPDATICVGSSYTMQPQSNANTNIWAWSPKASINDSTLQNAVASPTDTAQYILTARWGLCTRTDTMIVNVLHKPVAHAGNDTAICYRTQGFLRGRASNVSGPVSFLWTPSNTVTPSNAAFATAKPDSTQLYTLTVKDNYGCNFTVSDDVLVTMQPPVPAYAGNDTNAVVGVPHPLFSSGGVSYLWSPAGPLNNANAQFPLATLQQDTYFTVEVTDVAGCKGSDGVFIKAYKGPTYYLPNAFTPNGDGLNDIFRPTQVGIKSTEYFKLFNRYGEMMFETKQWKAGWDGTYKGQKQPAGTYVWIIKGTDNNGKPVEMKGTVILIR